MTGSASPLVSIVIPVYNCELYLGEAIESVLAQTYRPIEVIVVDDGSSDGTAEVARRFSAAVRYTFQSHAGIGAARNCGVSLARGSLLSFLDADDRWPEYKLAEQVRTLMAEPGLDMVFGYARQLHHGSEWSDGIAEGESRLPSQLQPGYIPGTMLVRLNAFHRVGPFETKWKVGEFIDWHARATELGLKTKLLPRLMLWRRVHRSNQGIVERRSVSDYAKVVKASLDRRRAAAEDGRR